MSILRGISSDRELIAIVTLALAPLFIALLALAGIGVAIAVCAPMWIGSMLAIGAWVALGEDEEFPRDGGD